MLTVEHYFASTSFADLREGFRNAEFEKDVPSERVHRLVTEFWGTGGVSLGNVLTARQNN
jgi:hypothetical protein